MTLVHLLPPVLALLLLAAHFFRASAWIGVALTLAMIALLFVRRPFVARIAQIALVLGGAEWMRTAIILIRERSAADAPYLRLALILGSVALCTLLCALVFRSRRLRARYRLDAQGESKNLPAR